MSDNLKPKTIDIKKMIHDTQECLLIKIFNDIFNDEKSCVDFREVPTQKEIENIVSESLEPPTRDNRRNKT